MKNWIMPFISRVWTASALALISIVVASSADAATFLNKDALGRWHDPNGSTLFEFQAYGVVTDSLHPNVQGKTTSSLQRGANLAIAYPNKRVCYYSALLAKDNKHLFLAEKGPKTPNWPCYTGVLVKSL